jgi:hypocretin (orexin) receptor 2
MSINVSTEGNISVDATSVITPLNVQNGTLCFLHYCGEALDDLRDQMEDYVKPKWYEWLVIVIYIITFIIGLTGNILVCFAVWRNRQMRTVTNMFIVNLSVADLGIIIICLPPTLMVDVTETWYMGLVMCKAVYFLMVSTLSMLILLLVILIFIDYRPEHNFLSFNS